MKFLYALTLALIFNSAAMSQKYVPQIKEGTVITYNAHSRAFGQSLPLILTITKLTDTVRLQWNISILGTGTFEISPKGVASGNKMGFKEPEPDGITKLKDNETLGFLSKSSFSDLTQKKAFTLNGQDFAVIADTAPFMINDKEADVISAATTNGKTQIWVLNNPAFPLICKIVGAPQGIDLALTAIKE